MELSNTIRDIYWTFVLPSICLFSLTTNTINIIVFYSIKSRNVIYKYMLFNSVFDQLYLVTVFFVFIIRCGQFCEIENSYFAMFYAHYIYIYAANSISLYCIFIEISILVQRYNFLTNKNFLEKINKKLFFCLLVFCFVYHLPQLTTFEIKQVNSTANSSYDPSLPKTYTKVNIIHERHFIIKNLVAIQAGLRLILIFIMIYFFNRLSFLLFKKYESILSSNSSSNKTSDAKGKSYFC